METDVHFEIARQEHIADICKITEEAKAQLKKLGLDQWQKGYPSQQVWQEDVRVGRTWVVIENDKVIGAFAFETKPEPSYAVIDGSWKTDGPYAAIHRVCVADSAKGRGVAGRMFQFGFELAKEQGLPSVRIDTHPGNTPMIKALSKAGFILCGTIRLVGGCEDGNGRIAFEKCL